MDKHEGFQQILDAHNLFLQLRYEHWLEHEAYTSVWWLLLCAWILSWIIWFFFVNKRQIVEFFCYGITIMFITTLLDTIGSARGLWNYSIKILPYMPELEPIDWGILPVTYMLIYQYFPKWKGFIIAHIIIAILYSFVGEPFLVKILEIYLPLHWKYIYSFPIYLILAIIPKVIINNLYRIERHSKRGGEDTTQ